jgi:hypothetical protein
MNVIPQSQVSFTCVFYAISLSPRSSIIFCFCVFLCLAWYGVLAPIMDCESPFCYKSLYSHIHYFV